MLQSRLIDVYSYCRVIILSFFFLIFFFYFSLLIILPHLAGVPPQIICKERTFHMWSKKNNKIWVLVCLMISLFSYTDWKFGYSTLSWKLIWNLKGLYHWFLETWAAAKQVGAYVSPFWVVLRSFLHFGILKFHRFVSVCFHGLCEILGVIFFKKMSFFWQNLSYRVFDNPTFFLFSFAGALSVKCEGFSDWLCVLPLSYFFLFCLLFFSLGDFFNRIFYLLNKF